jgi:hypothetical protein
MKKGFAIFLAVAMLATLGGVALASDPPSEQIVLNFDELTNGGSTTYLASDYAGLNWDSNWFWCSWEQYPFTPSSPDTRIATHNYGGWIDFSPMGEVIFEGAYFSGWDEGMGMDVYDASVYLEGYLGGPGGTLVGTSATLDMNATPTWLAADFGGPVDYVIVVCDQYNWFAMDDVTYTLLLEDKVSVGGNILQEDGPKKKDWCKISFGGWAGTTMSDLWMGAIEVTFHNVSNNDFDKAKFTTDGMVELAGLYYVHFPYWPAADPPESMYNAASFMVAGDLLDEDGNPIAGDWYLVVYSGDGSEPSVDDAIGFELWDGLPYSTGTLEYDSDTDFDEIVPPSEVTTLDNGNVQIVVPPAE